MADPLTALMHAVQVMNFLKTLILRTLKGREEAILEQVQGLTSPEASEGDEPDSDCNNVLLTGLERHSSRIKEATILDCDESSGQILIPVKRDTGLKSNSKSGSWVNTIDLNNQKGEAWWLEGFHCNTEVQRAPGYTDGRVGFFGIPHVRSVSCTCGG